MLKKLICALALCLSTGGAFAQVCGDGGQFVWDPSGQNSCYGGSQGNRPYGTNVYDGVGPPVNNGTGSGSNGTGMQTKSFIKKWGAFAVDSNTNVYGYSSGYSSKFEAEEEAETDCGATACKIVGVFYNQCGSLAWGGGYTYFDGGKNRPTSEKNVLKNCRKDTKKCQLLVTKCSLP
ncbi:MAG: DUF4189 domain-containing protein [Formosimonas sp.]